jgi:hypothetical protein
MIKQNSVIWVFQRISHRRGGTAEYTRHCDMREAVTGWHCRNEVPEYLQFANCEKYPGGENEYLKSIEGISFRITA